MGTILKLVHEGNDVAVTLSDGVTVHFSFNPSPKKKVTSKKSLPDQGHFHIHTSGLSLENNGPQLTVHQCLHAPYAGSMGVSNNFDVTYTPCDR